MQLDPDPTPRCSFAIPIWVYNCLLFVTFLMPVIPSSIGFAIFYYSVVLSVLLLQKSEWGSNLTSLKEFLSRNTCLVCCHPNDDLEWIQTDEYRPYLCNCTAWLLFPFSITLLICCGVYRLIKTKKEPNCDYARL
jgi:hypothetical protein